MKGQFVKDLEHMYLVFDTEELREEEYSMQMALRGRLPSLLPLSISHTDGKAVLRADVTGCTAAAARFQTVQLKGNDIRKILMTIHDTVRRLPGYLLDPGDLCLEPEYIFLGPDSDEILLCYIPHLSEEDPDTIRILAEYFLKKLDHSDRTAADLAYGLFDQVAAEHYIMADVLQKLLGNAGITEQKMTADTASHPAPDLTAERVRDPYLKGNMPAGDNRAMPSNNIRVLPPPPGRSGVYSGGSGKVQNRHGVSPAGNRKKQAGGHTRKSTYRRHRETRTGTYRDERKAAAWRFLPAVIIVSAATAAAALFRMDLTQIGGMGFLCAALIWLTYSTLEKRKTEIHNVWVDEDDPGDDAFYQSLLKQVYAEDALNSQYSDRGKAAPYAAAFQTGMQQTEKNDSACRPCLVSLQPDRCPDILLTAPHLILGKSREKADVILPDDAVSRIHARIERRVDGYYINDLYSTNGTFLDNRRLESGKAEALKEGSILKMGSLQFQIQL